MKKVYALLAGLLSVFACRAQTYQYLFNGNFNEASNSGPALTEVLSCGATSGAFGTSIINTTNGPCGSGPLPVFNFNQGGGVSYPNNGITGTYTIHMFFSFATVSGYRRVIDLLGSVTDVGLYILNGSLNFYPNGNVGTPNFFVPNTYYLITLVRDAATNQIAVYVNGTPFVVYTDNAGDYRLPTTTTPVILFEDNTSGPAQCESSAGSVKYFSIQPTTATAAQVATTYTTICGIVLPLRLLSFNGSREGSRNELRWATADESHTAYFNVERSSDGKAWQRTGTVAAAGTGGHTYTFADEPPFTGAAYYRLKMVDDDGRFTYSNTIFLELSPVTSGLLSIRNNPASGVIRVGLKGLPGTEGELRLMDMQGQTLWHGAAAGDAAEIPVWGLANGIYLVAYSNGAIREVKRVTVQN